MGFDVVREAAKESSFQAWSDVRAGGSRPTDHRGTPHRGSPGTAGGMAVERLSDERGKVRGSAKR
jgi:hypothetical protein